MTAGCTSAAGAATGARIDRPAPRAARSLGIGVAPVHRRQPTDAARSFTYAARRVRYGALAAGTHGGDGHAAPGEGRASPCPA
jgi:hypothetical protein